MAREFVYPSLMVSPAGATFTPKLIRAAGDMNRSFSGNGRSIFYLTSRRLLALQIGLWCRSNGMPRIQAFTYSELLRRISAEGKREVGKVTMLQTKANLEKIEKWIRDSVGGFVFDQADLTKNDFVEWCNLLPTGVPWIGGYCLDKSQNDELEQLKASIFAEVSFDDSAYRDPNDICIQLDRQSDFDDVKRRIRESRGNAVSAIEWPFVFVIPDSTEGVDLELTKKQIVEVCLAAKSDVFDYTKSRSRNLELKAPPAITIATANECLGFLASTRFIIRSETESGDLLRRDFLGKLTEEFIRSVPRKKFAQLTFFFQGKEVFPISFNLSGPFVGWNIEARVGAGIRRFHPSDLSVKLGPEIQPGASSLLKKS